MRKKILLCVCGITPQIITETLYGLCIKRCPPFIPDEIHVITTSIGKRLIVEKLLATGTGKLFDLIKEYQIPRPIFDESTIYVIQDRNNFIDDIIDETHNRITSNFILQIVEGLCLPEENWVHASIAGGRKTMSLFLGMAMQFYAKETDEMSHVFVNPPFENHPDFYYPTNPPKELTIFDNQKNKYMSISTKHAKINLAMIPFIKLRNLYLKNKKVVISDLTSHVEEAQKVLTCPMPILRVDFNDMLIHINCKKINLTSMEKAIYFYFLINKIKCKKKKCDLKCNECFIPYMDIDLYKIAQLYKSACRGISNRVILFEESIKNKNILEWFLQHRSRINKKLREADPLDLCTIKSTGRYGNKVYGISLPKERISFDYHP